MSTPIVGNRKQIVWRGHFSQSGPSTVMNDIAVEVHHVSKKFHRGEFHDSLRDLIPGLAKRLVGRGPRRDELGKGDFWALKDVSFQVKRGEVLGIIGKNGAGKSTILKVLSKILKPNRGRIRVNGRLRALIEVGAGFHNDLTGRENIYLNGSILGMKKREIDAKLDEIVEFADIKSFLETPVKRYSSGMYARLGFAVAAHLDPEILVVDEVLAVGDVQFQKKCLGKMGEVSKSGRTVLFVSHNMAAVENLCNKALWISEGRVQQHGCTRDVLQAYLRSFGAAENQSLDLSAVRDRQGTGYVRFLKLEFLNENGSEDRIIHSGGALRARFHYECQRDMQNLYFGLRISSNLGVLITDVHSWSTNQAIPLAPKGRGTVDLEIDFLNLMPGTYHVGLWATSVGEYHDLLENVAKIDVEPSDYYGTGRGVDARFGLVFFPFRWKLPEEASSGRAEAPGRPGLPVSDSFNGLRKFPEHAVATSTEGATDPTGGSTPTKDALREKPSVVLSP